MSRIFSVTGCNRHILSLIKSSLLHIVVTSVHVATEFINRNNRSIKTLVARLGSLPFRNESRRNRTHSPSLSEWESILIRAILTDTKEEGYLICIACSCSPVRLSIELHDKHRLRIHIAVF